MKTIKEIKAEEDELRVSLRQADDRKAKKIRNRLEALRVCKLYLLTNPSEEFVKSELKRVNNLIRVIDERFPMWSRDKTGGVRNYAENMKL